MGPKKGRSLLARPESGGGPIDPFAVRGTRHLGGKLTPFVDWLGHARCHGQTQLG